MSSAKGPHVCVVYQDTSNLVFKSLQQHHDQQQASQATEMHLAQGCLALNEMLCKAQYAKRSWKPSSIMKDAMIWYAVTAGP